jgi:hypothetical protein
MLAAIGTGAMSRGGEGKAWGRVEEGSQRHEPDSRASAKLREVLARRRSLYEAVARVRGA